MTTETRAQKATSRTLVEFQNSKEYEDELTDAGVGAYPLTFVECKKQVCHLMPKVDLSSIQVNKESDELDSEEAEAKEDRPHSTS